MSIQNSPIAEAQGPHNISVAVRIRPLNTREANQRAVLRAIDENTIVFDAKDTNVVRHGGSRLHSQTAAFCYDHVFDELSSSQHVFEATTEPLLSELLRGYNCSCFAYGATGAGKTYTMMGDEQNPGVMVLTLRELYTRLDELSESHACSVTLSYLEIYNENIRDLLAEHTAPLQIREEHGHVSVAGLSLHAPRDLSSALALLALGTSRRAQADTAANLVSSRSHAVCTCRVTLRQRGAESEVDAKLQMVDLAGSERAANTKNFGARLLEGSHINKSLLALSNCITALSSGQHQHVPYRNSKLTRLLKDAMGGNSRTVMIANVTPAFLSRDDTHNTLQYAARAARIRTHASRNTRTRAKQAREERKKDDRSSPRSFPVRSPPVRATLSSLRSQFSSLTGASGANDDERACCLASLLEVCLSLKPMSTALALLQRDIYRELYDAEKRRAEAYAQASERGQEQQAQESDLEQDQEPEQELEQEKEQELREQGAPLSVVSLFDELMRREEESREPLALENIPPLDELARALTSTPVELTSTPVELTSTPVEPTPKRVRFVSPTSAASVPSTPQAYPLRSILTPHATQPCELTGASTEVNTMVNSKGQGLTTPSKTPRSAKRRGQTNIGAATRIMTPRKELGQGETRRSTLTSVEMINGTGEGFNRRAYNTPKKLKKTDTTNV